MVFTIIKKYPETMYVKSIILSKINPRMNKKLTDTQI